MSDLQPFNHFPVATFTVMTKIAIPLDNPDFILWLPKGDLSSLIIIIFNCYVAMLRTSMISHWVGGV